MKGMKKLLSLLASLGLASTAAAGVVACSDNSLPGDGGDKPAPDENPATNDIQGNEITSESGTVTIKGKNLDKVKQEDIKVISSSIDQPKTLTPSDIKIEKTEITLAFSNLTFENSDTYKIVLGHNLNDADLTVNITAPAKPEPPKQSFAVAKAPATFKEVPTSEELAKDFAVKGEDGKPIEGVTYKFVSNDDAISAKANLNVVSFAQGVSGFVMIKVPVAEPAKGEDKPAAPQIKVETTPAAKDSLAADFNPDAIAVSQPFEVNGVNLSGDLIESSYTDNVHTSKAQSYVTKDALLSAITSNSDVKNAVAKALFDGNADEIEKEWTNTSFKITTGMDIDQDNVNKDFTAGNGTIIPTYLVTPNGTSYQLELTNGENHFWLNLGFNKNVTGLHTAASEISNIKFNGGRELTADVTNMSGYAGMKDVPVVFSNLLFTVTRKDGNSATIPYTEFSSYGIKDLNGLPTTTDNGEGIGGDSEFSNGKLDLKWGPNWALQDGDRVSISYTDFTGVTRTAVKAFDTTPNFEVQTITLDSSLVMNVVNPVSTAGVKSYLNKDKVIAAVKNNDSLAKIVDKQFGIQNGDYSKLNYEVATGMSIFSGNVTKKFDENNGKKVLNRMVVPNGNQYQIGLNDGQGNYYWFNANFNKAVTAKAPKASKISHIRFAGAREITAKVSNMSYAGMTEVAPTFANLEFRINGNIIPYTYDSVFEDNTNPDYFNNHGDGLSWRSTIKDGTLDLKWGNGWRNSWWLKNGDTVQFSYTDFTGARVDSEIQTVDFSNPDTDEISLWGNLLDNEPYPNQGVNAKSYINKQAILDKITDDEEISKDAYSSLFGWDTNGKSFADALKDKANEFTYDLAKGMKINASTAYKAKEDGNGVSLANRLAIPDGEKYQVGLHTNDGKYFWLNMNYQQKVINKDDLKQSQISNIRFVGGRELTADITNMNYAEMDSVAPIFANFSFSINGNRIPYTDWSRYGDNAHPDSWNHGDGISWRPTFKDGKLDLIWGKWWNLNNGDKIHIEYTDFTGNTVKSDSVVDFSNPELNAITLSGDLLDNTYTDGKQNVDRKSYINTAAIIDQVSKDDYEAKNVYDALFGPENWITDHAAALKAKENEISFDVAKDMTIDYNNAFKAYDGKLLGSRLAIPNGSKYEVGLKTKSGAHFWINMSFAKTLTEKAKESQMTNIKLGDASVNHGRSLDMDVTNMAYGEMNDITPVFADVEFRINGERIPYTTWSTIGDQAHPDWNPWNTGNGIGVMSRFQNGKLHLEWGPGNHDSWFLHEGSTIQISYTDFTGHRVDTGELTVAEHGELISKPMFTVVNGKTEVKLHTYGLPDGYVPAYDSVKLMHIVDGKAPYVWQSDKDKPGFKYDEATKTIRFTYNGLLQQGETYQIMFKSVLSSKNNGTNSYDRPWIHSPKVVY